MSTPNSVLVGTWTLSSTKPEPAQESLMIGHVADTGSTESALPDDARVRVPQKDFQPGGPYYSVVKLQIRYERQAAEDQRWAQGTGWLIKPDLLVTAGHCVYDHTYHFGKASEIKAYVGYNGKDSINSPGVQFRRGAKIATTDGWLQSDVNRANDVGFVQLDRAFDNVTPISFHPTPTKDTQIIGVVGYPADKTYKDEPAAQMYYMFRQTAFDLDTSSLNMLEYTISSFAGQSGSPVFIKGTNSALGAHVYGLGNKNSASVIRGKYGNHYGACIETFAKTLPTAKSVAGITYAAVPVTQAESTMEITTKSAEGDAEGFWDTLKSVVHIGAPIAANILQAGSPFLGPVGGVAAGLAGTLLGVAGKMTESSMGTESSFDASVAWKQPCSRAVLAEAALQTVLKMDHDKAEKFQIYSNMEKHFTQNKQHVRPIAKVLGPALLGPTLRVSQMNLNAQVTSQTESSFPAIPVPPEGESGGLGPNYSGFTQGLVEAAAAQGTQEFSFGSFVTGLVNVGTKVAPVALNVLGSLFGGSKGAESSFTTADDDMQPHLEALCHRAVMADAALQSLMAMPPEQLKAEGFFGDMLQTVKKIGSTVLKAAPQVIRTITPIISAVVQGNTSGGSAAAPASGTESGFNQQPIGFGGKPPGKSVADMLRDSTTRAPPQSLSTGFHLGGSQGMSNGTSTTIPSAVNPNFNRPAIPAF